FQNPPAVLSGDDAHGTLIYHEPRALSTGSETSMRARQQKPHLTRRESTFKRNFLLMRRVSAKIDFAPFVVCPAPKKILLIVHAPFY
ncbi:MAG TPA: hypothetical protein VM934_08430, partial [Pyrinomonadaceae bacterium]|nr:hypothetical protein [Pyrinomonadaceae bacterium]